MADKRKTAVVFHLFKPYDLSHKVVEKANALAESGFRVVHKNIDGYDSRHDAVPEAHTVVIPDVAPGIIKKDFAAAQNVEIVSLKEAPKPKPKPKTAGK